MTPEEKRQYMKEYVKRPEVQIHRKEWLKNYYKNNAKERDRLRALDKKIYWAQQDKLFKLGIKEYERTPDYSKESLCRTCGTIWPKCVRCPNCHVPVRNAQKYRKKEDVHRY